MTINLTYVSVSKFPKCNRCRRHEKSVNRINRYDDNLCERCRKVLDDEIYFGRTFWESIKGQVYLTNDRYMRAIYARLRFWITWNCFNRRCKSFHNERECV